MDTNVASNTDRGEQAAPNKETRHTVIEEGTEISGKLKSGVPLVIKGKLDGELDAPAVAVAASGALTGKAKVGKLVSEGLLSGQFEADSVRLAGKVGNKSSIKTRSLEARLTADKGLEVTFGECVLTVGDEPSEPKGQPPPPAAAKTEPAAPKNPGKK
ncbi:MAG: polymer-forming cytoskeletal protein [Deltaproteobacteria bacterium]|jgi:cytoskeletal protein CcmA (bactofilin family)|nr:polymer-forming cytoskeletal protein [Deltaproteobacteria bacterium]